MRSSLFTPIRQSLPRGSTVARSANVRAPRLFSTVATQASRSRISYATIASGLALTSAFLYWSNSSPLLLEQPASGKPGQLPNLSSGTEVVVDPDTKQELPLYLSNTASSLPAGTGRLKLVGLGVRTVSFLRVRVYVAALYVDENKLSALVAGSSEVTLEERARQLVDSGAACVIRIVPVRSTDFAHLRDGFIRALQGRLKKAIKAGEIQTGSSTEEAFSRSIQDLKESFPRGSVPKGSALDLVITPPGRLGFEYEGKLVDQVQPPAPAEKGFTAARELLLAYFAQSGEISAAFKKSVEQGVAQLRGVQA